MGNSAAERLAAVASAEGGITRLAFARALGKGVDVDALLRKAGLSRMQIEDPDVRISVRSQVVFLDLVAKALDDDLLGFHLSQDFDLRMIGLLYYVFALRKRWVRHSAAWQDIVQSSMKVSEQRFAKGKKLMLFCNLSAFRVV